MDMTRNLEFLEMFINRPSFVSDRVLCLRMAEETLQDGSSACARLRSGSGMVEPVLEEQGVSGKGMEDQVGAGIEDQVGAGIEVGEQSVGASEEGQKCTLTQESRFGTVCIVQWSVQC